MTPFEAALLCAGMGLANVLATRLAAPYFPLVLVQMPLVTGAMALVIGICGCVALGIPSPALDYAAIACAIAGGLLGLWLIRRWYGTIRQLRKQFSDDDDQA